MPGGRAVSHEALQLAPAYSSMPELATTSFVHQAIILCFDMGCCFGRNIVHINCLNNIFHVRGCHGFDPDSDAGEKLGLRADALIVSQVFVVGEADENVLPVSRLILVLKFVRVHGLGRALCLCFSHYF